MEKEYVILVVDQEQRIRRLMRTYLEHEGYRVDEASDGAEALQRVSEHGYDLVILDLVLPKVEGLRVCEEIRKKKATPIMILTALDEEIHRIEGFEAGADDYVTKPFSPREVIYRIKAILRRTSATAFLSTEEKLHHHVILFPPLMIDHTAREVIVQGTVVPFTPKEYDLLYYLAISPGRVFSRETLLSEVWRYEFFGDLRTVDTHIKRVRKKLKKISPEAASMVVTVWGVGYKWAVPEG